MKLANAQQRGSVILLAMIFSAISILAITYLSKSIVTHHRTTMRYGLGYTAFHLAESGVEMAMYAISNEKLSSSDWPADGQLTWNFTDSQPLGQYASTTDVRVIEQGSGLYLVTALATIDLDRKPVQRAVEILVRQATTETQEEANTGSGAFAYGMIAKDSIKLNHNNPGMKVSSYDSNVNWGVPIWGENTGSLVTVATPSVNNSAIQINNSVVHGAIRTGGGTISYNSGYNNPNEEAQNAIVIGPDSTQTSGVDMNYVSTDFDVEIPDPELPTQDGYLVVSYDQNFWQNSSEIALGSWGLPTWVDTERVNTQSTSKMTIIGDVVIDAYRNLNLGGEIVIEPSATLTIMAGENISISADSISQQYPAQFQVIAKASQDVVLHCDVFTGVVNAPNSNVRLHGDGGTPKNQYRGAVVARYIEATQGVEFYYDVNLADGATQDTEITGEVSVGVGELELVSWAEIPPSKAFN